MTRLGWHIAIALGWALMLALVALCFTTDTQNPWLAGLLGYGAIASVVGLIVLHAAQSIYGKGD